MAKALLHRLTTSYRQGMVCHDPLHYRCNFGDTGFADVVCRQGLFSDYPSGIGRSSELFPDLGVNFTPG